MKPFRLLDPDHPEPIPGGICGLAVMTKAPKAGRVKTRLVPPLTAEEAAELNKCFLRDTAAAISLCCSGSLRPPKATNEQVQVGAQRTPLQSRPVAVYTPVGAESVYSDILSADFNLLPQRGDKFGERLYCAVEDLFKCGFDSVCLIDSDSPTVPPENFAQAVELLSASMDRVVLGPSEDGGYYAIGLKKPHRQLFEKIDWSTERVLAQTIQRATEMGLEIKRLPIGYDVDDAVSLQRLCNELVSRNSSNSIAAHTRSFLRKLVAQKQL
jgi:uncharacterized protein